jgi:hypothetical protein
VVPLIDRLLARLRKLERSPGRPAGRRSAAERPRLAREPVRLGDQRGGREPPEHLTSGPQPLPRLGRSTELEQASPGTQQR